MRAVLYARVSTKGQATDGLSLQVQEAEAAAWCKANGAELVGSFVDVMSGRKWNRPRWQEMLAEAEATPRPFDVLLVYRLDRLSRSLRDLLEGIGRLEDKGIRWASITQPELSGISGRMMMGVLGVVAEAESAATGARVRGVIRHRQARGEYLPTGAPFGYTYVSRANGGPRWDVNEAEADTVRRAFALLLELGTQRAVAKALLAEGRLPRSGRTWGPSTLAGIFQQEAYKGVLRVGKVEVVHEGRAKRQRRRPEAESIAREGVVPAIVDVQLWDDVQAARAASSALHPRSAGAMAKEPWTGLLACACGQGMRRTQVEPAAWYCGGRRDGGAAYPCRVPVLSAAQLCMAVLPALAQLVDGDHEVAQAAPRRALQVVPPRLGAEARLARAQEAFLAGALPLAKLLEVQAAHAKAQAEAPRAKPKPPSLPKGLAEAWGRATPILRGALLRSMVARIVAHQEHLAVHLVDLEGWPEALQVAVHRGGSRAPHEAAAKAGWLPVKNYLGGGTVGPGSRGGKAKA